MIYKLIFILLIIAFSVTLILPTFGEKEMQIRLDPAATAEQIGFIKKRFVSENYKIEEKDGSLIISGRNLTDAIMNEVKVFPGVKEAKILKHWAERFVLAKKINLGLDLQGGMQLVMMADFDKIEKKTGKKLNEKEKGDITNQALELIRNRIDRFGVSEPSIRPKGNEAIEIQLPGVKDPDGVKKAIGTTGRVEYRLVDDKHSKLATDWIANNYKSKTLPVDRNEGNELLQKISDGIKIPNNLEILYYYMKNRESNVILPGYPIVLEKAVGLAGSDIKRAWVGHDEYGGLAVHFATTPEGAAKFAEVTSEKNKGRRLAIIIDDKVRSAPAINSQISGGQAQITGDFSIEEVNTLARIIQEGALPVDLKIVEERTVGPSLGQDSIESGMKAAMVGFFGVVLFMIVYYKLSGFIADLGLILTTIFQIALLSWLGFTLTLPGIAGIILNFGMAVDANVIIFERIKEEIRSGKSLRMSVVNGFKRAFWAIFDSNITTMLAAFILFQFGTGPIKGFAVTLFIGILTSMFSALYITRFLFELVSMSRKIKKLSI
jgi:preprotein translocase subunit SecD